MRKIRDIANNLYLYSGMNPASPCWLVGADDGLDFCPACAEARLAAGHGEMVAYGCGESPESDVMINCHDCGAQLSYWLTDHGVDRELAHYGSFRYRKPPLKGDAYCIARLLDSAPDDKRVQKLAARIAKVMSLENRP